LSRDSNKQGLINLISDGLRKRGWSSPLPHPQFPHQYYNKYNTIRSEVKWQLVFIFVQYSTRSKATFYFTLQAQILPSPPAHTAMVSSSLTSMTPCSLLWFQLFSFASFSHCYCSSSSFIEVQLFFSQSLLFFFSPLFHRCCSSYSYIEVKLFFSQSLLGFFPFIGSVVLLIVVSVGLICSCSSLFF